MTNSSNLQGTGEDNGSVLIEFALVCSLFIFLFVGVVDYGIYIHQQMELMDSSAVGAHVGTYPLQQQNTAGMQSLGQLSTRDIQNPSIVATYFYVCAPGGIQVASSTVCNSTLDYRPLMYVQVTSGATVPAALKWTGISSSLSLQSQAIYRVPWLP